VLNHGTLKPFSFYITLLFSQISSINTRDYHVATLIGLLPAQTINVYLGSTLRSMHEVLSDNDTKLTGYISFLFEVCSLWIAIDLFLDHMPNSF